MKYCICYLHILYNYTTNNFRWTREEDQKGEDYKLEAKCKIIKIVL